MEEKWEIMVFVQSQSQMDSAPLKCRNSKEKAFYIHMSYVHMDHMVYAFHQITGTPQEVGV